MGESKRFYWLKLKSDFFEDDTIRFIEEQENGVLYVNFYLKLCLKSIINDGKLIRFVGNTLIPYDVKSLSKLTNTDVDTVMVAMELFKKIGLIEILDTGEIYLSQINEMIGSETDKAQLMRKKRAREKLESNIVTQTLPECYTENRDKSLENRDKSIDINIPYKEIVDFLNLTAGTKYKSSTPKTKECIKARWNEGFRLDDFKTVISKMSAKWMGTDFEQYLRPQTLFGTKFENYLNSPEVKKNVPDWYEETQGNQCDENLLNEVLSKQSQIRG